MFKKILSIIVIIVSAAGIFINFQPEIMNVSTSKFIAAPPMKVFPYINDLRKFNEWSPWAKMDPNSTIVFAGPSSGVGASFSWTGNEQVGEGTETIVKSAPGSLVELRLDFVKPMKGTSYAYFYLEPLGKGTKVTWGMRSRKNFIMKAVGLFMDCGKMMTDIFNQGLENLDKTVMSGAAK